jgi:hypothetical protein
MPYPNWICAVLMLLLVVMSAQSQAVTPSAASSTNLDKLRVTWVESGNLFTLMSGLSPRLIASGNAVRPYIAPDGKHVAFTRGQGGLPETLWLADMDGQSVSELVILNDLADEGAPILIGQIDWLDNSVLYFNTARMGSLGLERRDDLWRANIDTGEVTKLLSSDEGGAFSISPDRQHLALIQPGLYGETSGQIRFMDAQTDALHESLSYDAVSTGAEYRFYPEVFWEADSNAVRVAIPNKDLIYDEEASTPTVLWRLPINGSSEQIGSVGASFFGLPRWSSDSAYLVYLRRVGSPTSNQFALMTASGSGENAVQYDSGAAGSFGMPNWLPDVLQFMYPQGEPNQYWLGSPDMPPQPLIEPLLNPQFVDGTSMVYAAVSDSSVELRYLQLDNSASSLIATINGLEWIFDALIVE